MRRALTDEDLVIADYMRNYAAHIEPSAYWMKWDTTSKKIAPSARQPKFADRSFTPDEIQEILERRYNQHGDGPGLTRHFARLILPLAGALKNARFPFTSDEALSAAVRAETASADGTG